MIECEDSVSPLWLCVCCASRMALKAVCLSLWSLLNTKKNRYEPSQVPVCSQWIGSGSLGSSVLIVWRSQQNRLFFSFADINSKLNLLCGDKTLFSRWTSKHMLTTVSLCASEDSLMLQECHIVPMFFFFFTLWDRPLINYIMQNLHFTGFVFSSGLMLLLIWLGRSV